MLRKITLTAGIVAVLAILGVGSAIAMAAPHGGACPGKGWGARLARVLNLSEAQIAQTKEIKERARDEAARVLTPEQRERAQAMRQGLGKALRSLDLTPEQKATIKTILLDARPKMKAIRENTTLTPEERRAQLKALKDETLAKIKPVLTAEQLAKLEPLYGEGIKLKDSLTPEQKTQLKAIAKQAKTDFLAILTPEQQAQLQSLRANCPMKGTVCAK